MDNEIGVSLSSLSSPWTAGDNTHLYTLLQAWENTAVITRSKPGDLKPILQILNEWFTSLDNKGADALAILHKIVAQSTEAVFSENVSMWWQQVTNILFKKNQVKLHSLALMIIRNLVKKSVLFESVNRVNCGNIIPHVIECINDQQTRICALDCLEKCLQYYGGSCNVHKNAIETQLVELFDKVMGIELLLAAKCMAWLPIAGGGISQQQSTWRQLQLRFIGSLHIELDSMFEQVSELPLILVVNKDVCLDLPTLSEKRPVARVQQLELRIRNLCQYLTLLLVEPIPVTKSILVEELLQVICRGLAVTGLSLGSGHLTLELQALKTLLPIMHCSMFQLLNALILTLGKNLIPYHATIFRLVLDSLKWTNKEKQESLGQVRAFSELRTAAYKTLILWLQQSLVLGGAQAEMDKLLSLILADVIPEKGSVALRSANQPGKSRKRKQVAETIIGSTVKTLDLSDSALCATAFETLTTIIQTAGCLLKADHHKLLHRSIMPTVLDLHRGGELHSLYRKPSCQVKLLELLLALVLHAHPQVPPPTSWAIIAFSAGQRSSNFEVSLFSKNALHMCENLTHPAAPSLLQNHNQELEPSSSRLISFQQETSADVEVENIEVQNNSKQHDSEEFINPSHKKAKINRDEHHEIITLDSTPLSKQINVDDIQCQETTEVVTLDSAPSTPDTDDNCTIITEEPPIHKENLQNSTSLVTLNIENMSNTIMKDSEPIIVIKDMVPAKLTKDKDAEGETTNNITNSSELETPQSEKNSPVVPPEDFMEMIQDFVDE